MAELEIYKIPNLNLLVIRNISGRLFTLSDDSIMVSVPNLAALLLYLVRSKMISKKVLEGILSEIEE